MYLSKFQLKNFRNYSDSTIELGTGLNYFVGENGQGKSNFLEAVYALSIGKSFRTSSIRSLIKFDNNSTDSFVRGIANQDNSVLDLSLILNLDKDSNRTTKKYLFNGSDISSIDFIGKLNVVLFEARDLNIIIGNPIERRKFLDIHISQQDHSYLRALQRYNKVLTSRNKVLKEIKLRKSTRIELEFWTEKIVEDGSIIFKERMKRLNQIRDETIKVFSNLVRNDERLEISFKPSFRDFGTDITIERIHSLYNQISDKEIAAGTTLIGPHRDDFEIFVNNKSSSEFSSRGQIRTITLALKLGEANVISKNKNQAPILALDDVLSELDERRRKTVMDYISDYEQILLTAPNSNLINYDLKKPDMFKVHSGDIIQN